MAKSANKGSSGSSSRNDTMDKIAKAAMSKEMLAAGLAAAAAAISASPSARRKIRDAGLDAADTASQAATSMMSSATKLGSIIAEAVADAAQRVMSGKWGGDEELVRLFDGFFAQFFGIVAQFFGSGFDRLERQVHEHALDRIAGQVERIAIDRVQAVGRGKCRRDGFGAGEEARAQIDREEWIAFGREPFPKHVHARPGPRWIVQRRNVRRQRRLIARR